MNSNAVNVKVIFFKTFLLTILHAYSQPIGDYNWNSTPYFLDDFNTINRTWVNFFDQPLGKWKCFFYESGVTHGNNEKQVYQPQNAIFDTNNGYMLLKSQFMGNTPLSCNQYLIPIGYMCDSNHNTLFYKSGAIESLNPEFIKYGYFEIKCKLPVHKGAFPAFWLWGGSSNYTEEIDIFEYSWLFTDSIYEKVPFSVPYGSSRIFTSGFYYGNNLPVYDLPSCSYARSFYLIPSNEPDLTSWNTFALEWSPRRLVWYFNNKIVNEYHGDSVPHRPMLLKTNYALDKYSYEMNGSIPFSNGLPDTMCIDYIRVFKLKCNCNENAVIQNNTQLQNFNYAVKKSIEVNGLGGEVALPSNARTTFRATDFISINQNFFCTFRLRIRTNNASMSRIKIKSIYI